MRSLLSIAVASLLAVASGDGGPPPSYAPLYEPANYAYQYAVKDDYFGVDFKADESRAAENTAGSYQVLLPDGRLQTVVYKVNGEHGGYEAEVSYNGEPVYPVEQPAAPTGYRASPTPSYKTVPVPTTYRSAPRAPAYEATPPAPAAAADPVPDSTPAAVVEAEVPAYTPEPQAVEEKVTEAPAPAAPAPAYRQAPASYNQYREVPSSSYRHYSPARASTVYRSRLSYKAAPKLETSQSQKSVEVHTEEEPVEEAVEAAVEEEPVVEAAAEAVAAQVPAAYPVLRYRQRSTTPAPTEEERKAKSVDANLAKANAIQEEPIKQDRSRSTTTSAPTSTYTTTAAPVPTTTTVATTTYAPTTTATTTTTTTTPATAAPTTTTTTVQAYTAAAVTETAPAAAESILAEAQEDAAAASKAKQTKRWLNLVNSYGSFPQQRRASPAMAQDRSSRDHSRRGRMVHHAHPYPQPQHQLRQQPEVLYGQWSPLI